MIFGLAHGLGRQSHSPLLQLKIAKNRSSSPNCSAIFVGT